MSVVSRVLLAYLLIFKNVVYGDYVNSQTPIRDTEIRDHLKWVSHWYDRMSVDAQKEQLIGLIDNALYYNTTKTYLTLAYYHRYGVNYIRNGTNNDRLAPVPEITITLNNTNKNPTDDFRDPNVPACKNDQSFSDPLLPILNVKFSQMALEYDMARTVYYSFILFAVLPKIHVGYYTEFGVVMLTSTDNRNEFRIMIMFDQEYTQQIICLNWMQFEIGDSKFSVCYKNINAVYNTPFSVDVRYDEFTGVEVSYKGEFIARMHSIQRVNFLSQTGFIYNVDKSSSCCKVNKYQVGMFPPMFFYENDTFTNSDAVYGETFLYHNQGCTDDNTNLIVTIYKYHAKVKENFFWDTEFALITYGYKTTAIKSHIHVSGHGTVSTEDDDDGMTIPDNWRPNNETTSTTEKPSQEANEPANDDEGEPSETSTQRSSTSESTSESSTEPETSTSESTTEAETTSESTTEAETTSTSESTPESSTEEETTPESTSETTQESTSETTPAENAEAETEAAPEPSEEV